MSSYILLELMPSWIITLLHLSLHFFHSFRSTLWIMSPWSNDKMLATSYPVNNKLKNFIKLKQRDKLKNLYFIVIQLSSSSFIVWYLLMLWASLALQLLSFPILGSPGSFGQPFNLSFAVSFMHQNCKIGRFTELATMNPGIHRGFSCMSSPFGVSLLNF